MPTRSWLLTPAASGVFAWRGDPARPEVGGWWSTPEQAMRWLARQADEHPRWQAPAVPLRRRDVTYYCGHLHLPHGRVAAWRGHPLRPDWVLDSSGRPVGFRSWHEAAQRLRNAGRPARFYVPRVVWDAADRLDPIGDGDRRWYVAPAPGGTGWWAWQATPEGQIRVARDQGEPIVFPTLAALAAWVRSQGGQAGGFMPAATQRAFILAALPQQAAGRQMIR